MENLIILYFVYITEGAEGQGRVSILDIARWMRMSKPTAKKRLDKLVDAGYLIAYTKWSNGKPYRWDYALTQPGRDYLSIVFDEAYQAYRIHVERIIKAIRDTRNPAESAPVTKKQAQQEAAGQKRMF